MLLARFENLRQYIPLDIATGDIVMPIQLITITKVYSIRRESL